MAFIYSVTNIWWWRQSRSLKYLFLTKLPCSWSAGSILVHVCNCFLINIIAHKIWGISIINLHTKFHIPSSDGSFVTVIKHKAKYRFHAATTLFCYIIKMLPPTKVVYFLKIYYSTLAQLLLRMPASLIPQKFVYLPCYYYR